MKTCIACGMPMEAPSDYAMNNPEKEYCVHCARPDGSMQSYEEKKESMAMFMVKSQGLDKQVALTQAAKRMEKLPAWQNR